MSYNTSMHACILFVMRLCPCIVHELCIYIHYSNISPFMHALSYACSLLISMQSLCDL